MIQIFTPDGTKEITDEEAIKLGIKIQMDMEAEINKLKSDVKKLKESK